MATAHNAPRCLCSIEARCSNFKLWYWRCLWHSIRCLESYKLVQMAFTPRTKASLGIPTRSEPVSGSRLEARSFFRQAPCSLRDKPPNTAQHRLWLDISTVDIAEMEQMDKDYNSNLWKNFRFVRSARNITRSGSASKDFVPTAAGKIDHDRAICNGVAENYPLKLPKPSRVGANSYEKFIDEATLTEEKRNRIRRQLNNSREPEKRVLKVRSECRAPPIDWDGNVVPPAGFRRYPRHIEWDEPVDTRPLPYTTHMRHHPRPLTREHGQQSPYSYSHVRYGTPSWHRGVPLPR